MAASEQFYRNQRTLDVVFAVSSVLMLVSVVWMFADDYFRPFKTEQRAFRDVEAAVAQRLALRNLPADRKEFDLLLAEVREAEDQVKGRATEIEAVEAEITELRPLLDKKNAEYQDVKASLDSKVSFYDIAVEKGGPDGQAARQYKGTIGRLEGELELIRAEQDDLSTRMRLLQQRKTELRAPLTQALTRLKQYNEKFDSQVQAAINKEWSVYDAIRSMPIIDGFASPIKIEQFTINDVPIDYNFKSVTRFDRCTTCHLGIDKADYTRENLASLRTVSDQEERKLKTARELLEKREGELSGLMQAGLVKRDQLPDPSRLELTTLSSDYLSDARVNEFCVHPRLDLYVGPNSPHPQEKFGCTSCHSGQGSATEFSLASHTPNSADQLEKWQQAVAPGGHGHTWEPNHYWDFPMLPQRFVESSCLKCHHEVTDLITSDNRVEAPKLIKGYNLIRENGCFGCHEINGWKDGERVGPDMRLEMSTPLEELSDIERAKVEADPDAKPGDLRKVGPSLYRIVEKTDVDWAERWLKSPRSFRPDTRMPHFYNTSTNSVGMLPEDQKTFPDAEIESITHYLFTESRKYLDEVADRSKDTPEQIAADLKLAAQLELKTRLDTDKVLVVEVEKKYPNVMIPGGLEKLAERDLLEIVQHRIRVRNAAPPIEPILEDYKGDVVKGRALFTEKGCLACHRHEGTQSPGPELTEGALKGEQIPAVVSDAQFGPNLSQIKAKLVGGGDDKSVEKARVWLSNWIRNPHLHSPRTKMPVVPLTDEEVLDITGWLLDQPATELGADWDDVEVKVPEAGKGEKSPFYKLAEVYLRRKLSEDKLEQLYEKKTLPVEYYNDLPSDEQFVIRDYGNVDSVKYYLGKKAISRQGCFACHSIPGFEDAKSIGVGLQDWGKKDPTRLAFEDVHAYVTQEFRLVNGLTNKRGEPVPIKYFRVHEGGEGAHEGGEGHGGPGGHGAAAGGEGEQLRGRFDDSSGELKLLDEQGNPVDAEFEFDAGWPLPVRVKVGDAVYRQKLPYERFFEQALHHHDRMGFLHQKLLAPRSYDFNRIRAWDDRSRMPQFRFARTIRKPGESIMDFAERKWAEEAEARESVMTFVLGLVAEKLPAGVVNQPTGPRLAEVRGRKILDKYNCGGCHLIRPGVYEFELNKDTLYTLNLAFQNQVDKLTRDYDFLEHHAWMGRQAQATGDIYKLYGAKVRPPIDLPDLETGELKFRNVVEFSLAESFRYPEEVTLPAERGFQARRTEEKNLRSFESVFIPAANIIYPPQGYFESPEGVQRLKDSGIYGEYGGDFSNLLVLQYLTKFSKYRPDPTGDNNQARASGPPSLIGEGARTRSDWLYRFLLNPQPVRKMVVLRMPQFNMSGEEARGLVDYFAAVEQLTNPNSGLTYPYTKIPQQKDLEDPYWRQRTAEYVARLKSTKATAANGEPIKGDGGKEMTWYEQRVRELTPVWQQVQAEAKAELQAAREKVEALQSRKQDAEAAAKKAEKDAAKAAELQERVKGLTKDLAGWQAEVDALQRQVDRSSVEQQKKLWAEEQAYLVDGFRLLLHPETCWKCHQIGNLMPSGAEGQGPPLALAEDRLRPEWVQRWIANPQRLIYYPSPMPAYFEANKLLYQESFVGPPLDQVTAARDVLMIYQRAVELPVNRHLALPDPTRTKTGEKE